jgi:poly(ADP-ribose) glycohydrolase
VRNPTTPENALHELDDLFSKLMAARELNDRARDIFARSMANLGSPLLENLYAALPNILRVILETPTLFAPPSTTAAAAAGTVLKFVMPNESQSLTLTRRQVFCLLSQGLFALLAVSSRANFLHLYVNCSRGEERSAEVAKLQMIVNYFIRVDRRLRVETSAAAFKSQLITYDRATLTPAQLPVWETCSKALSKFDVVVDDVKQPSSASSASSVDESATVEVVAASIESQRGAAQCDFANKFIGGGVISGGCVQVWFDFVVVFFSQSECVVAQEEIRFAVCAECIVALLFNTPMSDRDAIVIRGAEQFSAYKGYGHSLQFDGDFNDSTPIVGGHVDVTIVCIDACDYRRGGVERQYTNEAVDREANKVVVSLSRATAHCARFATGNWGCGVFKGDLPHKAAIQWVSFSLRTHS